MIARSTFDRLRWSIAVMALALVPCIGHAQTVKVEYYHLDALGSVRLITGEQGQVVREIDYEPFGEEVSPAATPQANTRLFTGHPRDRETGLDYFGARYYRAEIGRFTTVDPAMTIKDNLVDPQRWNRYAYARNNPLKYVDPQGLDAWDITNSWTSELVKKYSDFASSFISQYRDRIDCADLAFVALIMFASENKLPLQLKYFDAGARAWRVLDAASKDFTSRDQYLSAVTRNLGALNVIDNTKPLSLAEARGGDVIMTKYDGSLGHTRVIQSSTFDVASGDYRVVWYQGNLPPVVPERRESLFGTISSVYGNSPRRWSFGTWR